MVKTLERFRSLPSAYTAGMFGWSSCAVMRASVTKLASAASSFISSGRSTLSATSRPSTSSRTR